MPRKSMKANKKKPLSQKVPLLEKSIIKKVYRLESKRTSLTIVKFLFFFCLITGLLLFAAVTTFNILQEQQTLDLLELFNQDWEIIRNYFFEVASVFYEEMPKNFFALSLLALLAFLVIFILLVKNARKIKNRLNSLHQYQRKGGESDEK